jgi:mono/diheme cytochrome c family protein
MRQKSQKSRFGEWLGLCRSQPMGSRVAQLALMAIAASLLFCTFAFADMVPDAYKSRCAACHGAHGMGDTMIGNNLKIRNLASDEVQKRSDDELFNIISKGRNRMPAFDRKLSPDQIRELVKHIRSLKK